MQGSRDNRNSCAWEDSAIDDRSCSHVWSSCTWERAHKEHCTGRLPSWQSVCKHKNLLPYRSLLSLFQEKKEGGSQPWHCSPACSPAQPPVPCSLLTPGVSSALMAHTEQAGKWLRTCAIAACGLPHCCGLVFQLIPIKQSAPFRNYFWFRVSLF